jgi:Raf kinase inhibitor-like YbhB/YbcL family protein
MKALAFSLALVAGSGLALAAAAQAPAPAAPAAQPPIVVQMAETMGKAKLKVSSADVKDGVLIPNDNSAYGKSLSPQVSWTKGPAGTKSYAVLLEDSDANARGMPITHWLAFNIPATATSLAQGLPPQGAAAVPAGMLFGNNITGKPAYFGPRTPALATHHYHLQVVALDMVLPLAEGAPRNAFVDAAKGHVLASGEVVGIFTGPPAQPVSPPAVK